MAHDPFDREITDQVYSEARLEGMSHHDALRYVIEWEAAQHEVARIAYDRATLKGARA